ncbi:probable 28S ribosomal protein S26, mitochondrial [Dendroctonus ponderosae]
MLRAISNFNPLRGSSASLAHYHYTGYDPSLLPPKKAHRKPRWVPVAKSKRFRVPQRPKIDQDEYVELLRLHNNYRNNVKSLRHYMIKKYCDKFQTVTNPEEILEVFKVDLAECHAINDQWNAKVKVERESRIARELQEAKEIARQKLEAEQEKQKQILELAEEIVKKEKEASATFITAENIDEAIDNALNDTVDYNFAIDSNGEKLRGRETRPSGPQEKISVRR